MKTKIALLSVFLLMLVSLVFGAYALTMTKAVKTTAVNTTTAKVLSSASTGTSQASSSSSASLMKTSSTKATASAKTAASASKLQVVGDRQVQLVGASAASANTVCFNPSTQIFTVADTPQSKQYQFRSARARCGGGQNPSVTSQDEGIEVSSCESTAMTVRCSEGTIISYGGQCEGPAIGTLFTWLSTRSDDWSDLPTTNQVRIACETTASVGKVVDITCMREKP